MDYIIYWRALRGCEHSISTLGPSALELTYKKAALWPLFIRTRYYLCIEQGWANHGPRPDILCPARLF